MASQQAEKPRGLPNPYASRGLPNPYASATISAPPVKFSEEAKAEQKKTPAFHNPHNIKRPQAKGPTAKKPPVKKPMMPSSSSDPAPAVTTSQQPGLDWWRSTADDDAEALDYRRQLIREQKEKKKQEKKFAKQYGYWKGEAPYKPERPSNILAYRASGGWGAKLHGFAGFLHAQPAPSRLRNVSSSSSSVESDKISRLSSSSYPTKPELGPPVAYNQASDSTPPPPPPPPADQDQVPPPPPPPPPASTPYYPSISAAPVRQTPTGYTPGAAYGRATISAPPVRYDVTDVQMKDNIAERAYGERPAKRPKISKAEAMMAKMGYIKGQGLGKNKDGITTHLEVKARANSRRVANSNDVDEDGNRNIKSQQVFDILGGHTTKRKEPGRFGDESKVVVAWGCVDDVDWAADADRDDGGIRQEMGQTFDAKFGRVERIYVNMSSNPQSVYIKFASELSALNAVNRFHEGYQFRGREIRAQYYNEAKFEAAVFDH